MRNKVALINFPPDFEVNYDDESHLFYEIVTLNELKEFILCQYQGIIVYDPENKNFNDDYNFFSRIHTVDDIKIKSLKNNFTETIDQMIGRERLVNPRQFEIIKGSVVKSKIDKRLGPGIVVEINKNTANVKVNFPEAENYYRSNIVNCHISHLRAITTIEEVKRNDNRKKHSL